MDLTEEEAEDLGYGSNTDTLTHVANEQLRESRWMMHIRTVFSDNRNDVLWAFDWQRGLTENQEDYFPLEVNDTMPCYRVEPYEVATIKYRPVK